MGSAVTTSSLLWSDPTAGEARTRLKAAGEARWPRKSPLVYMFWQCQQQQALPCKYMGFLM